MNLNRMTTDELFIEARNSLDELAKHEDTLVLSEIEEIAAILAAREAWAFHDFIMDELDRLGSIENEDEDYSEEN